jgi:hypothetical protein
MKKIILIIMVMLVLATSVGCNLITDETTITQLTLEEYNEIKESLNK